MKRKFSFFFYLSLISFFTNSDLEIWYKFLDAAINNKVLLTSVYTINNHLLSHVPHMIRSMGPLRAYSCRPMERMIGKYKRLAHSRIAAGENIGNIMELLALFAFLKDTGMVSLEPLESKPLYKDNTFDYHPSGVKEAPQLWDLTKIAVDINDKSGVILGVPITKVEAALRSYMRRLNMVGTSMQQTIIFPAKRLWRDSQVISSALYTFSKKGIQRSSEFVMLESSHLK